MDSDGNTAVYTVKEVTGDEDYAEAIVEAVLTGGGESLNISSTWTCDQEGIRAPITSFSGLPFGIETSVVSNEEGVFLPPTNELDFGSQWTYGTTFEMDITSPDAGTIQMTNERNEVFTSEKMTDITVPAGSFEVLEISGSYTVDVTLMGGMGQEFPGTEVLRFAEGVGLVKNQVDQQGVYTVELVEYSIPE